MPQAARCKAEVASGAKIIRRRQSSFAGSQLVCRILNLVPVEFGLHVDAMVGVEGTVGENGINRPLPIFALEAAGRNSDWTADGAVVRQDFYWDWSACVEALGLSDPDVHADP